MGQTGDCEICQLLIESRANPRWVADFDHTTAFLDIRQTFRGRTTLMAKTHFEDMLAIPEAEFASITQELRVLAKAIQNAFGAIRMNYANYGNIVPHQHWHAIPRYEDDPCSGADPIEPANVEKLSDQQYEEIAVKIRQAL